MSNEFVYGIERKYHHQGRRWEFFLYPGNPQLFYSTRDEAESRARVMTEKHTGWAFRVVEFRRMAVVG